MSRMLLAFSLLVLSTTLYAAPPVHCPCFTALRIAGTCLHDPEPYISGSPVSQISCAAPSGAVSFLYRLRDKNDGTPYCQFGLSVPSHPVLLPTVDLSVDEELACSAALSDAVDILLN